MRKSAVMMPLAFLLAGVLGLFVRRWELDTVFDSATGLTERNATVTLLLIAFRLPSSCSRRPRIVVSAAQGRTGVWTRIQTRQLLYVGASFIFGLGLLAAVVCSISA
jgi:hypothetical protein